MERYRIGQIAEMLAKHPNTIRKWDEMFRDFLSTQPISGERQFTAADLEVLSEVSRITDESGGRQNPVTTKQELEKKFQPRQTPNNSLRVTKDANPNPLLSQLAQLKGENEKLKRTIAQQHQDLESWQQRYEMDTSQLRAQTLELLKQYTDLTERLEEKHLKNITEQLIPLHKEIGSLSRYVEQLEEQRSSLSEQVEKLTHLKVDNATLQLGYETAQNQIEQLAREKEHLLNEINDLKQRLDGWLQQNTLMRFKKTGD